MKILITLVISLGALFGQSGTGEAYMNAKKASKDLIDTDEIMYWLLMGQESAFYFASGEYEGCLEEYMLKNKQAGISNPEIMAKRISFASFGLSRDKLTMRQLRTETDKWIENNPNIWHMRLEELVLLARLDTWGGDLQKEYVKKVIDRNKNKLPMPSASQPAPTSYRDVIEGRIDGDFEGWEGETIVKLMNGDIWQQTEYYYYYHYAYSPKVTIVKSGSTYKMKVDGVSKAVGVVKLK